MMNEKLLLLIASVSVITGSEAKGHTNQCIESLALLQPCTVTASASEVPSDLDGCCDGLRAFTVAGCFCNPGTSLLLGEDGASLGDSLGPVCRQIQTMEWAEVPTSQSCSDFDAYDYGCAMSDNTLEGARLGSFLGFGVLFEDMNADVCFDTPALVAGLGAVMDEDPELYGAYGLGTYKGVVDMAEYFGISFIGLNHGFWSQYPSTPAQQAQSYVLFSDDDTLLSSTVNSGFFAKGTLPYSDIRTDILYQFRPCSIKPWRVAVPPSAGFAKVNNFVSWVPTNFKVYGPEFICKYHENFCIGQLSQYDSEQECVDFMLSLPIYSEQCGLNTPLSGNSLGCRWKHHMMIPTNPGLHCYHIGRNSTDSNGNLKCNDDLDCSDPAVLAANAKFPLDDVDNPPQEVLEAAAALNEDEIVQTEPFGCAIPFVNPQQTDRTERPCLAECNMQINCYEECVEDECGEVCRETEVCTFEVGRDELSSELGYFEFKGVGGDTCPGGTNPVLGIKKGATYLFTQRRTGNYYHPLGFAYGADGALDEQPELEPGICPGTVKGKEDTTDCDCKEKGLCPAPMYYTSNNYLGEYSNNPYLAPIQQSDDFGLDAYEPQFFYPLLQWKGTPKEEDPTGPGYYQVALHFPEDTEYTGDFFYFCHIHQYMTGRFKFVDEAGLSISPDNTLRIPYEYQEPDAYDRSCGATGIGGSQLPDMECPTTFVCDAPDAAVAPFAAKFAECVDSMNCAMLKGITTKISSDSPIALFNHQMIPHHQQAVNMCKALDVAQGTECEDIFDEDKPECVLKVLCQEIINVQNAQIQTMRGILQQLELPDTDNCIVDIPVDPQTACEAQSGSTGYSWCVLTQTCVAPGDDACLEAECEENSIVTGKHWCALTQTCFMTGDQSCEKAYCELESGSTGSTWCELIGTCVAPGDDACLEATCEDIAELNSGSTGYSWCDLLEVCLPPTEDCVLPTGPPAPTDTPVATFAPTAMATFSPTLMPTRSSTSKSSKSSKSRRHTRQLKYE